MNFFYYKKGIVTKKGYKKKRIQETGQNHLKKTNYLTIGLLISRAID